MAPSTIDYPAMIRVALRGVVRDALALTARDGLPGDHHFYLSFDTTAPGVSLPRAMRDLHPERMTIILQHQYWDLEVDEERFGVTLSFGGQRQRLSVPFTALLAFADPAVGLELRFEEQPPEPAEAPVAPEVDGEPPPEPPAPGGGVLPFARPRRR